MKDRYLRMLETRIDSLEWAIADLNSDLLEDFETEELIEFSEEIETTSANIKSECEELIKLCQEIQERL